MRKLSAVVVLMFLLSAALRAHEGHSPEDMARVASEMVTHATNLLNALPEDQRKKITYELKSDERLNWHFIPKQRNGLPLKEMAPAHRPLAQSLLASALSGRGFIDAISISTLEEILHEMEKGKGPTRDAENYFVTIFGKPGPDTTWAWRYEGHHLALNFTVIKGKFITDGPAFFGSNPENILEGPRKGMRLLGEVEDAGRKMMLALNDEQKKKATLQAEVPKDIFTAASRKVALTKMEGIPAAELTAPQKEVLMALIKEYAHRMRAELAGQDVEKIEKAGIDKVYFGWIGETELKKPHYYRVHGPTFLIEYDNIQNNANHVHSVWRDLDNDFGEDLLKKHYEESHSEK